MHPAAGFCKHWLIILRRCASLRSHGVCGVRVVVQEQPRSNAPAVQQCISLINSAALSARGTSPTNRHESGRGHRRKWGPKKRDKMAVKEREDASQRASEECETRAIPPHLLHICVLRRRRRFFFSSLAIGPSSFPTSSCQTATKQPPPTLSFPFTLRPQVPRSPLHSLFNHTFFRCRRSCVNRHLRSQKETAA